MTTLSPVAAAVAPLKIEAVKRAEKEARTLIDRVVAELEAADWNLDAVAPRGDSFRDHRNTYLAKNAKHTMYGAICPAAWSSRRPGEPNTRKRDAAREAAFIEQSRAGAAADYDTFVAKLDAKIGPTLTAKLEGYHVWGFSILTVTKADGAEVYGERWKTQQIVNVSKLGKLFNQWPTRKVK